MLSILLTFLLASSQINIVMQPAVVNEVVKFEQVKKFPQSLGIKIAAKSALVIDSDSGQILFQKNSRQVLPIASLTKLMTAIVVLDANPDWQAEAEYAAQDTITLAADQNSKEPSQVKFEVGEKIKIKDLLTAGLVKSANNAVKTLVRQINFCCGKTFVDQMNQKAEEIGMTNTSFIEPTGLNPNNLSTAEDLAKLIQLITEKPEITKLLSLKIYSFSTKGPPRSSESEASGAASGGQVLGSKGENKIYQIYNTNKLLDSFLKIKVAKTGYLDEAGYCFAGLVEYNKKKLIVVFLGSPSEKNRLQEVKGLAYWASTKGY